MNAYADFSAHQIFSLVLFITVVFYTIQAVILRLKSPLNAFPGPSYSKWTNLRLKLAVITGKRIYYVHSLHKQYGHFVRISPSEVSISDPEAFKQIHRINSGFNKSPWYMELASFERPTLFTETNPKAHSMRRRLLARSFSKTYLRQNWEAVVRTKARFAVSRMVQELRAQGVADVLKWWTFMATDVSSHLMFGSSLNMLETGVKTEYIHVLESALMGGGIGAEMPLVRYFGRHIPIQRCRNMFAASEYLLEVARLAVRNAKSSPADSDKNLFAHIIAESANSASSEENGTLDDLDVQLEASGLIVAGSDTTAITLTYLVWCVLSRPSLHRSLHAELCTRPKDYNDALLEDTLLYPILNAVIEETLRLFGAVPGALPRMVPAHGASFNSADGTKYFCPPGTTVSTQAYTIHRDPNVFSNPNEFDHKRFLISSNPGSPLHAMLHPFGAGTRSCLGIHLARMELRLAAAEFFLAFDACPQSTMSESASDKSDLRVKISPTTTTSTMEMENFFLVAPKGHKCEIVLA